MCLLECFIDVVVVVYIDELCGEWLVVLCFLYVCMGVVFRGGWKSFERVIATSPSAIL